MSKKMLSQRAALATAALLLTPALASCGFDYATDQVYVPSVGVNDRSGDVDILNALIVSGEEGSGTFIATFVNNNLDEATEFTGLQVGNDTVELDSIEVPVNSVGVANLASDDLGGGVRVSDPGIVAGRMIEVSLSFSGQESVLEVPIVENSGYFEGIDGPVTAAEDQADH